MSTSARVSSNTFIKYPFLGGKTKGEESTRADRVFQSRQRSTRFGTGDSEQDLTWLPNRKTLRFPSDFGGYCSRPLSPASATQSETRSGYSWPPHLYGENSG